MDRHDNDASRTKESTALTEAMAQLAKTVHCPVCMDYMMSPVTLPCSHTYCQECIEEVIKNSTAQNLCPLCQTAFARKSISSVSKTLEPVISSIKNFMACFEGKPVSDSVAVGEDALLLDKKFRMQRPDFKAGDLVHVAPRLWPGINKPGGTAWIQAVIETDEHPQQHSEANRNEGQKEYKGVCYDCKYVLGGGVDMQVPAAYIRVANDINEDRESRSRRKKPTTTSTKAAVNSSHSAKKQQQKLKQSSQKQHGSVGNKRKANALDGVEEDIVESLYRIQNEQNAVQNMPFVFLCSTLQTEDVLTVQRFCERFPPATVHEAYSNEVTHVIVRADRKGKGRSQVRILKNRTMKYLQGVMGHKWIVSCDWLGDCLDKQRILNEVPYEVTRDSKADTTSFGPKWSREQLRDKEDGSGGEGGLFDVGCQFIFAGAFCHPGPTIDNLSFLLKTGGGKVLSCMSAVVNLVNASLDGGVRVRWKQPPRLDELIVVVVTSEKAANEFCQQVFMSISDIRQECAYDFGDFIDHLNGFVAVILSDWIFDCISNYRLSNPLQSSRFRVGLDRSGEGWQQQILAATSGISNSSLFNLNNSSSATKAT